MYDRVGGGLSGPSLIVGSCTACTSTGLNNDCCEIKSTKDQDIVERLEKRILLTDNVGPDVNNFQLGLYRLPIV